MLRYTSGSTIPAPDDIREVVDETLYNYAKGDPIPLPIAEKLGLDVGKALADAGETPAAKMTVAQLDEKYGDEDGYPTDGKLSEKRSFAAGLEA